MAKIEIDLNDLGLTTYDEDGDATGKVTLQDLIVKAAAKQLVMNERDMRREVREQVAIIINSTITEKVKELTDEAFATPIQRMTAWGQKQGEPTTVLEMIREHLSKFLQGSGQRRDSYNRDPQNLADLIDDAVKVAMTKEMKASVDEAKKLVHTKVTDAALKAAVAELNR